MSSFSPESSGAFEGEVPCPRTQHLNNVPKIEETWYLSEKINVGLTVLACWFKHVICKCRPIDKHVLLHTLIRRSPYPVFYYRHTFPNLWAPIAHCYVCAMNRSTDGDCWLTKSVYLTVTMSDRLSLLAMQSGGGGETYDKGDIGTSKPLTYGFDFTLSQIYSNTVIG